MLDRGVLEHLFLTYYETRLEMLFRFGFFTMEDTRLGPERESNVFPSFKKRCKLLLYTGAGCIEDFIFILAICFLHYSRFQVEGTRFAVGCNIAILQYCNIAICTELICTAVSSGSTGRTRAFL